MTENLDTSTTPPQPLNLSADVQDYVSASDQDALTTINHSIPLNPSSKNGDSSDTESVKCLKEKLSRVEQELNDVRSAHSLMLTYQEDAIQTLKQQHEQEVMSLRSLISPFQPDGNNEGSDRIGNSLHTFESETVDNFSTPSANQVRPIDEASGEDQSPDPKSFSPRNHRFGRLKHGLSRLLPVVAGASDHDSECYNDNTIGNSSISQLSEDKSRHHNTITFTSQSTSNKHANSLCPSCSSRQPRIDQLGTVLDSTLKQLDQKTKEDQPSSQRIESVLGDDQHKSTIDQTLQRKCEHQMDQCQQLSSRLTQLSDQLVQLTDQYKTYSGQIENRLEELTTDRHQLTNQLSALQAHYDALVGRRSQSAAELSSQAIRMPDSKVELELLALHLNEENLSIRSARDHLDERLTNESLFYAQQLTAERHERTSVETELQHQLDSVQRRASRLEADASGRDSLSADNTRLQTSLDKLADKLKQTLTDLSTCKSKLSRQDTELVELRQSLARHKTDLTDAQLVQADFVKLSQTLQVQLEHLRQAENEVRWVEPGDVTVCYSCEHTFPTRSSSTSKVNCRNCGKVHCNNCTKSTMPSGPLGRPARVCDFCHTLLNKNVAPFFSKASEQQQGAGKRI